MRDLWNTVADEARAFPEEIRRSRVARPVGAAEIRAQLSERFGDFRDPVPACEAVESLAGMIRDANVQVTHPRYFGLFNPSVLPAAAAGEALAAVWNPQLATWSHAPAANEIERHVLGFFAGELGFDRDASHATFTTGGAEANLSAVLVALARAHPRWAEEGLTALPGPVGIYLSEEGHDSFAKIARVTGLGRGTLRTVPVDGSFRMDLEALTTRIDRDRQRGRLPLMVVGTAGTTGAGAIDPLPDLRDVADESEAWFHVDAAWGGAAVLSPRLAPAVRGIELADSVTWDAHKGLSVPMGAGMFFCRHPDAVARAFSVRASYMPGSVRETVDPYPSTLQWSRRFIGLKVFLALAELGAPGYASAIEHQSRMGDLLRDLLREHGWRIVNSTPLPLVCFTHPAIDEGLTTTHAVEKSVVRSGEAWISSVRLGNPPTEALRACITSYRTEVEDLNALVSVLERSR